MIKDSEGNQLSDLYPFGLCFVKDQERKADGSLSLKFANNTKLII